MQDLMAMRLMDTMTEYRNDEITTVVIYAFAGQTNLESVSLPKCLYLNNYAFTGCTKLSNIYLPALKKINFNAFRDCSSLTEFITGPSFDSRIDISTFEGCTKLTKADFYHIDNRLGISSHGLACSNLITLIIRNSDSVPSLDVNAFGASTTKMNTGEGKIYVPASMVDAYKAAANWSKYADQIYPLEELTE